MYLSVLSAEKPYFRLASTCSAVRSNRRGFFSRPSLISKETISKGCCFRYSSPFSAFSWLFSRSMVALNKTSRYLVFSSQYSSAVKASISFCRFTNIASVGVCTLPTESTIFWLPNFRVNKRVALMPSSQSPTARALPAWYKLSYCSAGFSFLKPSRIACSVSEEIQRR